MDAFKRRGRAVVVGGPFASLCPGELERRADVVFVDETEHTRPEFLDDYETGRWRALSRADEKPSMRDSPLPRFDLLEIDRRRSMTIQFARGCPFRCEFCDIVAMYGYKPRTKSVDQVMAELGELHRLRASNVFVVDNNFIGDGKQARKLLEAVAAW